MNTQPFKASTKYGDWSGTSAADDADKEGFGSWLKTKGHMQEGESLVGVELVVGENHGVHQDPVWVYALLAQPGDHGNVKAMIDSSAGPVVVRRVAVQMALLEFVGCFKRLEISFSRHGMLAGHEYTYMDY